MNRNIFSIIFLAFSSGALLYPPVIMSENINLGIILASFVGFFGSAVAWYLFVGGIETELVPTGEGSTSDFLAHSQSGSTKFVVVSNSHKKNSKRLKKRSQRKNKKKKKRAALSIQSYDSSRRDFTLSA